MKKTLQLIKNFEVRNNMSITLTIMGDGSGSVNEFWDNEELIEFKNIDELHAFLRDIQYQLDDNGKCLSPVQML
jgi:hypothetical protein